MSELQTKVAPSPQQPEPWLRGTLSEVPAVARGVLHALELAQEDVNCWCELLSEDDLNARPFELPPIAFHLRHVARSLDRLLAYAEGNQLSAEQIAALKSEIDPCAGREALFAEFTQGLKSSCAARTCSGCWGSGAASLCWKEAVADERWWITGASGGSHAAPCRTDCDYGENPAAGQLGL